LITSEIFPVWGIAEFEYLKTTLSFLDIIKRGSTKRRDSIDFLAAVN
jgi:hypothetical protein